MKVAIAQIDSQVGNFHGNYTKILAFVKRAKKKRADLVIFGELSVCGYPPQDLIFKRSFLKANRCYLEKLSRNIDAGISCIVGFVDKRKNKIFNAAALFRRNKIEDIYHKIELPNYSVFDEKRYFSPGKEISIYELGKERIHLSICEDIWNGKFWDLFKADLSVDLSVNISASPYFSGRFQQRKRVLAAKAKRLGFPVIYVNQVGAQDELVFDGGSLVVDSKGKVLLEAKRFKEDLIFFNTKAKSSRFAKKAKVNKIKDIYEALILGLRDYVIKSGFKKVIIGVSGGIDSAVTLALAKLALGSKNVIGLIMPSEYTSNETLRDAELICNNLGIKSHTININKIYSSYTEELGQFTKGSNPLGVAFQNIQARIRGNLLMAFSNRFGYLVVNTGNKSELSVGYCTLYGDMVGGFGLLADVYKTKVYKLANYINNTSGRRMIPDSIIKRSPSAELRYNQKDEDDLPAYGLLDAVLKLYIEQDKSKNEIIKKGYTRKTVGKIIEMVDRNEYKRQQAPPGIKITPKAFGKDRRMPILNKFSG